MRKGEGELRVGTCGFDYRHWRGDFYPDDLPRERWLAHYATRFDAVELDTTFYGLPAEETVERWREQAPPGFRFALKYSRYATHLKHLADPDEALGAFLERVEPLGARLGPILVQLPPGWHADVERLAAFLDAAPRRHRLALEFRERSWLCDAVLEALEGHGAALVIHDGLERHPVRLTTGWTYLRFHGGEDHGGSYSPQALSAQAQRIRGWLDQGTDVHAFFNNDAGGHAPRDAADLLRYAGAGSG